MKAIDQLGSQTFSFARYTALLKTYLAENGKTLGLYTAALIGVSVLVGAFIGYNFAPERFTYERRVSVVMMSMYITFAYSFCFSISASLMFSSLQTRASRISTFMLPASMLEKYLVRLTVYLFVFAICFIIAMLCGEGVRLLASPEGTMSVFEGYHYVFEQIRHEELTTRFALYSVGSMFAGHGLYTLGSALWPKHSFFKTFVASIVISVIFVTIMPSDFINRILHDIIFEGWTSVVVVYIWAIVLYVLAWWRFSTTQIVQRFMMN